LTEGINKERGDENEGEKGTADTILPYGSGGIFPAVQHRGRHLGMLQAGKGVDSAAIVDSALRVFGTELGICGFMTIFKRWMEQQDRRTAERQKRREAAKNE
jgi:UDP-N-acetylglucosamine pyrophosphorylase